ncbi:hypothetical protein AWRI3579_g789 [Hanseniaspora osmophila]|uniref:Uncharacterized protein n=1 Tax=Hanseniaspora osmophila TaxID=56408 RepID=A0A1E5RNU6_9ASCO|nr:hypothetical protein AWRI3579_g789 [Hanseniaspora osmophila]
MSAINSYSTNPRGSNTSTFEKTAGLSRSTTNHSFQHSVASNGESVLIDESDLSDNEHGENDHNNNNNNNNNEDFDHPFGMAPASKVPSNAASMIFERTVEDPFVPINPHNNLTRTNSIVSLGNGRTNSIVSLHNLSRTNSNANVGNLFSSSISSTYNNNPINPINNNNNNNNINPNNLSRTNSWADMRAGSSPADINGRRSSMSIHRTLENYIAPSLDASAHLVGDKSTNLDQIQIQHLQANGMYNNHPNRRPSTLGLYTTSGAATPIPTTSEQRSAGNTQDESMSSTSPISPLMSPSSPNLVSSSYVSSSSTSASSNNGRPKILRMYSYADVLNDEKQFRRPSLSQSSSSSILLNTNSFNSSNSNNNNNVPATTSNTPASLNTSNSAIGQGASFSIGSPLSSSFEQNSGNSYNSNNSNNSSLVSPSFSKPISTGSNNGSHPLASNVINSDSIKINNNNNNNTTGNSVRHGSSVGKDASPLSKRAIMTHHAVNKTGGLPNDGTPSRRTSQSSGSGVFEKLKPEEYKQRQYGVDQGGKSPLHYIKN